MRLQQPQHAQDVSELCEPNAVSKKRGRRFCYGHDLRQVTDTSLQGVVDEQNRHRRQQEMSNCSSPNAVLQTGVDDKQFNAKLDISC